MEAFDRDVRHEVYRSFVTTGRAPSTVYQARPEVRQALRRLAEAHVLVLDADDRVRMAMPFSDVPTPFSVTHGRGTWWANCIWDALGMGVVLDSDIDVETFCPDCHAPTHLSVRSRLLQGAGLVHVALPARQWWEDIVRTWGTILLFRSEEHVETWCRQTGQPKGEIVPLARMYRLARAWYLDRAHHDWQPRSMEESQALLTGCGLDGDFFRLQATVEQAR